MIEVLPFFHDLIVHSNMISHGKCRLLRCYRVSPLIQW